MIREGLDRQFLRPQNIPVYSLFRWGTGVDGENVQLLIAALKGDNGSRAFRHLASEFSLLRCKKEEACGDIVFCPAPAAIAGQIDHAYLWAEALAHQWGVSMVNILKRGSLRTQKTLDVDQRRETTMELWEGHSVPEGAKIIFVDDVITTGSTARAAWSVLGKPRRFEVWTVACRAKLFLI